MKSFRNGLIVFLLIALLGLYLKFMNLPGKGIITFFGLAITLLLLLSQTITLLFSKKIQLNNYLTVLSLSLTFSCAFWLISYEDFWEFLIPARIVFVLSFLGTVFLIFKQNEDSNSKKILFENILIPLMLLLPFGVFGISMTSMYFLLEKDLVSSGIDYDLFADSKAYPIKINFGYNFKNKQARLLYEQGIGLAAIGDYNESIRLHTEALELEKNHPSILYERTRGFECLRDTENALKNYSQAIAVDSNFSYPQMGFVYYKEQKNDSAFYYYSKAIDINPKLLSAYYNRAILYAIESRPTDACDDMEKVLQLDNIRLKKKQRASREN